MHFVKYLLLITDFCTLTEKKIRGIYNRENLCLVHKMQGKTQVRPKKGVPQCKRNVTGC